MYLIDLLAVAAQLWPGIAHKERNAATTVVNNWCQITLQLPPTKASVKSVHGTDQMDSKSKSCQDLNNQLAIYQAFRNAHGVAAVLRQMANEHCPIQKVVIR